MDDKWYHEETNDVRVCQVFVMSGLGLCARIPHFWTHNFCAGNFHHGTSMPLFIDQSRVWFGHHEKVVAVAWGGGGESTSSARAPSGSAPAQSLRPRKGNQNYSSLPSATSTASSTAAANERRDQRSDNRKSNDTEDAAPPQGQSKSAASAGVDECHVASSSDSRKDRLAERGRKKLAREQEQNQSSTLPSWLHKSIDQTSGSGGPGGGGGSAIDNVDGSGCIRAKENDAIEGGGEVKVGDAPVSADKLKSPPEDMRETSETEGQVGDAGAGIGPKENTANEVGGEVEVGGATMSAFDDEPPAQLKSPPEDVANVPIPLLGRQPKTRIAGKQTRFLPKRKLPTRKLRKEKQVAMAKEQKTKGGNSSNLIKGLQELWRSKRVGTVVEKGETKDNTKRKANTGSNTPRKKIKRTAD